MPSPPQPQPQPQPGGITAAAPASDATPAQWQWGLGVPPASMPSVSGESLTRAPRRPVLPTASHVPVEAAGAREMVWNPLEGDPIRMAALGASAEVQGLTPVASPNGKASVSPAKREAEEPVQAATTPPGARLKPVTGRRHRDPLPATISITAGSYRSNLAPPPSSAPPASAVPSVQGTGEAREWEPRLQGSRPARMLVALVVAVMVAAGAAGAIVVTMPARAVLAASLEYEREAAGPPIDNEVMRDFHQAQEGLLWSREVRDAAAAALAEGGAGVDAGALANLKQLTRAGRVRWDTNADRTRDELTLEYETTARERDADAERLTALFGALRAAAVAKGSAGRVGDLKLELLETEVNDYTRELEYLKRRLQTLQEELRIVRLGAPEEGEIDAMKNDVSRLTSAYQAALANRIRVEVEAGAAPEPIDLPTTLPAGGAIPPPPPPPPPLDGGPTGVEQLRKLERELLVELRTKERELAEATAHQEAIEEKEREMKGVTDTIDSLSRSLEEKRKELAEARGSTRPVFKPLPPTPARVIEERDDRPLWIGLAVAVISFVFAGYVALARGRSGE